MLLYDHRYYSDIESDEIACLAEEHLMDDIYLGVEKFYGMYGMHYPDIEISQFEKILDDCRGILLRQNELLRANHTNLNYELNRRLSLQMYPVVNDEMNGSIWQDIPLKVIRR